VTEAQSLNTPLRVVIDTQANQFTPLVSKATVTELIRVLAYPKFKLNRSEQEDLLADYLPFCETVVVSDDLLTIPECRDPFDVPFLTLALVSHADYLVTGDQDLLCLTDQFACPIIKVNQFLGINNF
jgi:uncharacterized protein